MGWRFIAMQMILNSSDGLEGLMTCCFVTYWEQLAGAIYFQSLC